MSTQYEEPHVGSRSVRGFAGFARLHCTIPFWEMVGHLLLWLILIIVTIGIGGFFYGYSLLKLELNHTELVDRGGTPIGRLRCEYSVTSSIGHVVLWILLSIVTLGIAFLFYLYRVNRVVVSETVIEYY